VTDEEIRELVRAINAMGRAEAYGQVADMIQEVSQELGSLLFRFRQEALAEAREIMDRLDGLEEIKDKMPLHER
jgi:hypothetical protein